VPLVRDRCVVQLPEMLSNRINTCLALKTVAVNWRPSTPYDVGHGSGEINIPLCKFRQFCDVHRNIGICDVSRARAKLGL